MKRSTQVGLVLMSAAGVGGTAYMLMPGEDCRPPAEPAALHAPLAPGAVPQEVAQKCAPRGSSGSGGSGSGYRGSSWGYGSSSSQAQPVVAKTVGGGATSSSGLGATLRSGFGSFSHGFSSGG